MRGGGQGRFAERSDALLDSPGYTPSRLLNAVQEMLGVGTDTGLAEALGFHHAVISQARRRHKLLTPRLCIAVMEATGMSAAELNRLAGLPPVCPVGGHPPKRP